MIDFHRQWQDGIDRVRRALHLLDEPELARLRRLLQLLMEQKRALQALVARVDAARHCACCRGACCVAGKYHFSRVDLLAYLVADEPLFAPRFDNGLCPYLGEDRCLMAAAYRPFNCITFNCERIEDLLAADELSRFYALEAELRENYREIRSIFPAKTMDGALLEGASADS